MAVHQPFLIRDPQTDARVHEVTMTCWYKVTNARALACWYRSGFLLRSHLIRLHLINTVLNLLVLRGVSLFYRNEKKKKIDGAPYESSVPSLSLSKHKDHYKSIKVCHVWNDISLCSRGIAWSVLVLDAAVAAVVAGCVVPRCQGLWGQAVPADRQRGRKPDSAAKPQSNVCLSSYLSLRLSLWLTVGHCLSACRILLLCSQEQSTACSWVTRSKKSYFYSF